MNYYGNENMYLNPKMILVIAIKTVVFRPKDNHMYFKNISHNINFIKLFVKIMVRVKKSFHVFVIINIKTFIILVIVIIFDNSVFSIYLYLQFKLNFIKIILAIILLFYI